MQYKPPILPPRNPDDWPKWLAELARAGARIGFCGRMCVDCAFKHPQPLTTDYTNAATDAVFQLAWDGAFHCHTTDHKDAGTGCIGFSYAKQYLKYCSAECYCLTCLWRGTEAELVPHADGIFLCCPACHSKDIVWLIDEDETEN